MFYTFLKDIKLSLKSFYFYMEIGFALVFVAVMVFLVPKQFETTVKIYAAVELPGPMKQIAERSIQNDDRYEIVMLNSRREVVEHLQEDRGAAGIAVGQEAGKITFDFIMQGFENKNVKNILETSLRGGIISGMTEIEDRTAIKILEAESGNLSDRLNILPVFLTMNAGFMGLFIIASYVFLDKGEGTIRAFAVTPGKVWQYLGAKVGVILVTGIVSGLISVIPLAGDRANYLYLTVLLICTNIFGSALGLFIASFFDSMQKAMGWLYVVILILGAAGISYFVPSFSPLIIRVLPSYPMFYGFREALLPNGDALVVFGYSAIFIAAGTVVFLAANFRFKRTLTV
jgi:hypothetical protein